MYAFSLSLTLSRSLFLAGALAVTCAHATFKCSSVRPSVCLPTAEGFISKLRRFRATSRPTRNAGFPASLFKRLILLSDVGENSRLDGLKSAAPAL